MAYQNPKCNKCGKEISFVPVKWWDGTMKIVPVEVEPQYVLTQTQEKNDKNQFIYISQKIVISHSKNCTSSQTQTGKSTQVPDDDKPPF